MGMPRLACFSPKNMLFWDSRRVGIPYPIHCMDVGILLGNLHWLGRFSVDALALTFRWEGG